MQIAEEAAAPAGEGEERQRHRNRHVDADLTDRDLVLEAPRRAAGAREDGGAVAVGVVVDQLDGLGQVRRLHAAQHRPEDFLAIEHHLRRHLGEQTRPQPVAIGIARHRDTTTIQQQLGAFLLALLDPAGHALQRLRRDQRPVAGALVIPGARAHLGQRVAHPLDQGLRITDEDRHRDRHAALTRRADTGTDQRVDHLVGRGVRHDHHVVLGPGEALGALEVVSGGAIDVLTHRYRADEADGARNLVGEQMIDLIAPALHHGQDALGGTRFHEQLRQPQRGQRHLLGRLEHEGIATGDGQREHPQRYHGGEVERRDA